GGSEDLRGFLPFRFYDQNSLVLNAEYRWHLMSILDMALFADGGKVFPRRGELNFSHLQGDGGIGFRFNYEGRPFMRIDIPAATKVFSSGSSLTTFSFGIPWEPLVLNPFTRE